MALICPKCGKDGGEFPFCPYCGEKMQNQSAVWRVGMPCPHCGGLELEGDRCAFCGATLFLPNSPKTVECYDIPYRKFRVSLGVSLELRKDALVIQGKILLLSSTTVIPYARIVRAEYFCQQDKTGEMVFHWWQTKGAIKRMAVKLLNEDSCRFFYQVFCVVRTLLPSGAVCSVNSAISPLLRPAQESQVKELERLFEIHTPSRDRAAKEFASFCKISYDEAMMFVDAYFQWRQEQVYTQDGRLAVRDYHRMMRRRTGKE